MDGFESFPDRIKQTTRGVLSAGHSLTTGMVNRPFDFDWADVRKMWINVCLFVRRSEWQKNAAKLRGLGS